MRALLAAALTALLVTPLARGQDGLGETALDSTAGSGSAVAPEPTAAPEPATAPWSQADQYYDPKQMAAARRAVQQGAGGQRFTAVMLDRLEGQRGDEDTALWDLQAWHGGDIDKLFIKSEGEYNRDADDTDSAEWQALWSHAVGRYFDFQGGLRRDFEPDGLTHAVVGVQGLAPHWFEVDLAAFISEDGDLTARAEAEYDWYFTQKLIAQPRLEASLSAQDIEGRDSGAGLVELHAGLRLRYEIVREFAPYLGLTWHGSFGKRADAIKDEGGDPREWVLTLGLRAWW